MSYKNHLTTPEESLRKRNRDLKKVTSIAYIGNPPVFTRAVDSIGIIARTTGEVRDTGFPILTDIEDLTDNLFTVVVGTTKTIKVELGKTEAHFHRLQLDDAAGVITDFIIDFVDLAKNKAIQFIADIETIFTGTPNIIFQANGTPITLAGLPTAFGDTGNNNFKLQISAIDTPVIESYEVLNGATGEGGGDVNFPIDFPEEVDRGIVTTDQIIDFAQSTRHSIMMTVGAATISIDLINPPVNELALSSITLNQDFVGGREITFVQMINNEQLIIDEFAALEPDTGISFMLEWERGKWTAYLKSGNIVNVGPTVSQWATFPAVSDIDFATFDGINIDRLLFNQAAGDSLAASSIGLTSNVAGDMLFNIPTGSQYFFTVNNVFSPAALIINSTTVSSQTLVPIGTDDLGLSISPWNIGFIDNITVGGAGDGIDTIGHLDFVDNLATPISSLSIYSDGTDMFANTGGGVVNLSDIGVGSNQIVQGDSSVLVTDVGVGAINFSVDGMALGSITTALGWVLENDLNLVSGDLNLFGNLIDSVASITSNAVDPADTGFIRMGNAETIVWESFPAGVDVTLQVNSLNNFVFSGHLTPSGIRTIGSPEDPWATGFFEFIDVNTAAILKGDVIMGLSSIDDISFNGSVNTNIIPSGLRRIGSSTNRWDLGFFETLDVGGNTFLGFTTLDTISLFGSIDTDIIPAGPFELGSALDRWQTGYFDFLDVSVDAFFQGNVILGDSSLDDISFTGHIITDIIPDGTHDLGSLSEPWGRIFTGEMSFDLIRGIVQDASGVRIIMNGPGVTFTINDSFDDRLTFDMTTGDLYPVDSAANLGRPSNRWLEIFSDNVLNVSFTKFKKNIINLDDSDCMDICNALPTIEYEWKDSMFANANQIKKDEYVNRKYVGFNADALSEMLPHAVKDDMIYQNAVIGILLGSIRHLKKRIDELEISMV